MSEPIKDEADRRGGPGGGPSRKAARDPRTGDRPLGAAFRRPSAHRRDSRPGERNRRRAGGRGRAGQAARAARPAGPRRRPHRAPAPGRQAHFPRHPRLDRQDPVDDRPAARWASENWALAQCFDLGDLIGVRRRAGPHEDRRADDLRRATCTSSASRWRRRRKSTRG